MNVRVEDEVLGRLGNLNPFVTGSLFQAGPKERLDNNERVESQIEFVCNALTSFGATRVLETGTYRGEFAYFLKLVLPDLVSVDTFDIDSNSSGCVDFLNQHFGEYITFRLGDTVKTLAAFNPDYHLDFAWVDGGHSERICISDLKNCARLGIDTICIDDLYIGGVNSAVEKFLELGDYVVCRTDESARKACCLRKKSTRGIFDLEGYAHRMRVKLKTMHPGAEGSLLVNRDHRIEQQTSFLCNMIDKHGATRVLETGTCRGEFAYFLKLASAGLLSIDTFDVDPNSAPNVDFLNQHFGEYITFRLGDTTEVLPVFNPDYHLDFAWVDGGHTEGVCLSDLKNCARLGIDTICIDDLYIRAVKWAVEKFLELGDYVLSETSVDFRRTCCLRKKVI